MHSPDRHRHLINQAQAGDFSSSECTAPKASGLENFGSTDRIHYFAAQEPLQGSQWAPKLVNFDATEPSARRLTIQHIVDGTEIEINLQVSIKGIIQL